MKQLLTGIVITIVLAGCSHTAPVLIGPDTYMSERMSAGGIFVSAGALKAELYKEANEFCLAQGKQLMPDSVVSNEAIPGRAMPRAEIIFRCLDPNDPALKRPVMRPEPNVRIEVAPTPPVKPAPTQAPTILQ